MTLRRFSFLFLTICFLLISCFGPRDLSTRNLSEVYRKSWQVLHPEFAVFLQSPTSAVLYAKINPKEFLYMRHGDDRFKASFTIRCNLVESYESTAVIDSVTRTMEVLQEDNSTLKVYSIPFSVPKQNVPAGEEEKLLLSINVRDNQKNYDEDFYVTIDNTGNQSRQAFFVQPKNDVNPLFRNYLSDRDTIKISYRDSSVKTLSVHYYHRRFPLAAPPFSFDIHDEFDYKPDSVFTYQVSDSNFIVLKPEGFYHFQADTADKNGLTLFRFANTFPNVTSPDKMLEAVRYITTKREFEEMDQSQNKKVAMDKFWIGLGGNSERTKGLIKKYYTRVQEANRFFSAHTEGWRTDRGMIYIVFGKPNNVYKSANAESWIYGQPNNSLSLNFFFVRVNNPFTDNDFTMTREPIYESTWYRAVDVWRQGRAYNDY